MGPLVFPPACQHAKPLATHYDHTFCKTFPPRMPARQKKWRGKQLPLHRLMADPPARKAGGSLAYQLQVEPVSVVEMNSQTLCDSRPWTRCCFQVRLPQLTRAQEVARRPAVDRVTVRADRSSDIICLILVGCTGLEVRITRHMTQRCDLGLVLRRPADTALEGVPQPLAAGLADAVAAIAMAVLAGRVERTGAVRVGMRPADRIVEGPAEGLGAAGSRSGCRRESTVWQVPHFSGPCEPSPLSAAACA